MRYRLIDVRIWCDKKFRALSPIQPSGRALFLYLLTNPYTTSIPGLYRAGAAAMAEELGWNIEDFHSACQELLSQGLVRFDFDARVVFIPNAIKYNKPQSANVIKSWASHWDEVPECALKDFARQHLKASVKGMGEGYEEAFAQAIEKAMPNQEQEQEQELSSLQEDLVSNADSTHTHQINCPHTDIIALYHDILPMCPAVRQWNRSRRSYLTARWREDARHQTLEFWKGYFEHVKKSVFLTGNAPGRNGKPPFIADLEWLIRPDHFVKVIEGKYHGGEQ